LYFFNAVNALKDRLYAPKATASKVSCLHN
jgi:hypothetical protein